MPTATKETLGFQAEVKQLLNLMIHSLYSNKEIFLRELISNAADAADKLRFEALSNNALYESDGELRIRISIDKKARTLTVSDNGVGMSRDEVVQNIGTIAKSGTREFFQSLTGEQAKDAKLIGQFGVGFYSAFIVADRVTLVTRRAGLPESEAVRWECDMTKGAGEYTIERADKAARGTDVILHLREGEDELLEDWRLKAIVRKYSDHIGVAVLINEETVNQASALWTRPKSEISEEQYVEFYRHVGHDFEAPLAWTHNRVEGRQEYTQLLYIPSHAPFDLWDRQHRHGLKLYVRRVFIMDDAEHMLPAYLRFVRGVVDSADLPLNVSREILQQSRDVDAIRAGCTKRVLGLLEDLAAKDKDKYATFWREFGRVMKEGPGEDATNKEQIARLLRFSTTREDGETVSLADYVSRMKEGQDKIYHVTAESFLAAKNSPHLEIFRKKDIEVLLLHDRVDEWLVAGLAEFQGKPLASVARGEVDLSKIKSEAEEPDHEVGKYADLLRSLKASLGEKVKDVRVSMRLTESPSCLVADEHDVGGNLARILKAAGQKVPQARPILEINPEHAIVKRLAPGDVQFDAWAGLLFDQALLAEGGQLEDPAGFVKRTNELMLSLQPR
jgi:molecular chaperone HtpG